MLAKQIASGVRPVIPCFPRSQLVCVGQIEVWVSAFDIKQSCFASLSRVQGGVLSSGLLGPNSASVRKCRPPSHRPCNAHRPRGLNLVTETASEVGLLSVQRSAYTLISQHVEGVLHSGCITCSLASRNPGSGVERPNSEQLQHHFQTTPTTILVLLGPKA